MFLETVLDGLGEQIILILEVLVESAHREPGSLHQCRDARLAQALAAKPACGVLHDPLVSPLLVPTVVPHTNEITSVIQWMQR